MIYKYWCVWNLAAVCIFHFIKLDIQTLDFVLYQIHSDHLNQILAKRVLGLKPYHQPIPFPTSAQSQTQQATLTSLCDVQNGSITRVIGNYF